MLKLNKYIILFSVLFSTTSFAKDNIFLGAQTGSLKSILLSDINQFNHYVLDYGSYRYGGGSTFISAGNNIGLNLNADSSGTYLINSDDTLYPEIGLEFSGRLHLNSRDDVEEYYLASPGVSVGPKIQFEDVSIYIAPKIAFSITDLNMYGFWPRTMLGYGGLVSISSDDIKTTATAYKTEYFSLGSIDFLYNKLGARYEVTNSRFHERTISVLYRVNE